jgi:hypothetical protein
MNSTTQLLFIHEQCTDPRLVWDALLLGPYQAVHDTSPIFEWLMLELPCDGHGCSQGQSYVEAKLGSAPLVGLFLPLMNNTCMFRRLITMLINKIV